MTHATGFIVEQLETGPVLRAASQEEQVKEALRAILLTRKGERAAKPELGSELHRYFFRPLSQKLLREMQTKVREAIARCEPRVGVTDVSITSSSEKPSELELRVHFEFRESHKSGTVKVNLHA